MFSTNCILLYLPLGIVIFGLSLIRSLPNDVRQANFYKLEGTSFNGSVVGRHFTQDYWDCLFLCVSTANKDCLSFNFGDEKNQGSHECTLHSSESKLEPDKIQDTQGVTYYGMTEQSLYRYLPCASSPCFPRQDCITGHIDGLYSCRCPLQDIGVKFVDSDTCTIDMQQISKGTMKERVARTVVSGKKVNFYEAEKLCNLLDASMASYDQLYAAWNANLSVCSYAWINDGTVAFPIHEVSPACGNRIGIIVIPDRDKKTSFSGVWCYYN